jgi:micrococcal nuclease
MRPRTLLAWLAALGLVLVLGGGLDLRSLAAGPGGAAAVADRVVRVVDGDTVQLARTGRARLIGVDTPEVHGRRECFGPAASRFATRRLRGRDVVVRGDAEAEDRYGRRLVYLFTGGRLFNAELVREGYATALPHPPEHAPPGAPGRRAGAGAGARGGPVGRLPRGTMI